MTNPETTMPCPGFKDRKTGLVVFGILEIILGAICALLIPFIIFGMIMSATVNKNTAGAMPVGMMIASVLFYALIAACFIWLGIGSIKARRWARALLLVSSWLWLIIGISGLIFTLVFMPDMYGPMAQKGQIPEVMATIMTYVMLGVLSVVYIIIPGLLVWFYGKRDVKLTCECRDPQARWTDKCPLPVLATSIIYGVWAGGMLMTGFYGWVMPFFGYIVSGLAGAGVTLVVALLFGYAAWGTYKLDIKAWWGAVLVTIAWAISTGITFSQVSIWDFYAKMNFSPQQMELLKQYDMLNSSGLDVFFGVWVVGLLGYLIYIKRYFKSPAIQEQSANTVYNSQK